MNAESLVFKIRNLISMMPTLERNEAIKQFEEKMFNKNPKNPELSYYFAKLIFGANILRHAQVVIKSQNAEYNYLFARDVEGADIERHGQAVIDSKSEKYNFWFAYDIEGANVLGHANVALESGNVKLNQNFLFEIAGIDRDAHLKIVRAGMPTGFYRLKEDLKQKSKIKKLNKAIEQI